MSLLQKVRDLKKQSDALRDQIQELLETLESEASEKTVAPEARATGAKRGSSRSASSGTNHNGASSVTDNAAKTTVEGAMTRNQSLII